MVELLAPARDFTALEAALKNGANAVYIGVENYNMRSHAPNFTMKKLKEASDRCHSQNARLYVCTNTVMNNRDIEHLNTILPDIVSAGADAIIASDLGVLNIAQDEDIDFRNQWNDRRCAGEAADAERKSDHSAGQGRI